MSFSNLLIASYWFSQPTEATYGTKTLWMVLLLVLIAGGIIAAIIKRTIKDNTLQMVLGRVSSCFSTIGIVGLIFFFMRQQRVAFLGWRFWFLPIVVIFVVWVIKIAKYWVVRVPQIKSEKFAREQKEKYLPKTK